MPVFGSDAVTPTGATIPFWRVSVVFIPILPPRAGGNPRTRPSSSVGGVAFLLEGVAWYAEDQSLVWWFISGGRSGGGSSALCCAAVVGICFFFFFLSVCCTARPNDLCIGVGCFVVIQSEGKHFFGNIRPLAFLRKKIITSLNHCCAAITPLHLRMMAFIHSQFHHSPICM